MPITKTAKKELRKATKRTVLNDKVKQDMKIAIKILDKKIKKEESVSSEEVSLVCKKIDKACKKNIIHRKNAAKKKSAAMKKMNIIIKK